MLAFSAFEYLILRLGFFEALECLILKLSFGWGDISEILKAALECLILRLGFEACLGLLGKYFRVTFFRAAF